MTDELLDPPNGWRPIEAAYPDFQLGVVRHEDTGEVLAVERRPGYVPWDHGQGYQTVILPEMYNESGDVNRFLAQNVSKEEAIDAARIYMEGNP